MTFAVILILLGILVGIASLVAGYLALKGYRVLRQSGSPADAVQSANLSQVWDTLRSHRRDDSTDIDDVGPTAPRDH
jgi:hypothetical protein